MRILLSILALLATAPACLAQEDFDLANALAERGWYDLSEEHFGKITNSGSLPPEKKAEGDYGMARIKILMAERAESAEEKDKLYEKAIEGIEAFRKKFPQHRLAGEALSDIGYLYQSRGKALMNAAKTDPTKLADAEKAFGEAEKLFLDLIAALKKDEKKMPENPDKQRKEMEAYEQWEEKVMFAKYNYALALFAHAETFKDEPKKHADMKRLLEAMNKFLNDDFMWQYERYLLAYDAFIYMGRAYQLLAEASDREKAEDYWRQCFIYVGKAKSLLSDPEARKNEAVREICMRALLYEMKARVAYGDIKRGQTAIKQYADAAKLAEEFFKAYPNARFEETGKAVRLEQARVYCKGGQLNKGVQLLQELSKQYKDSWVENIAVDILGEYGADASPALAVDAANNFFERGPAFLYKAMQKYRKALAAVRKAEDQKYVPECWYQIGRCYYYLDRYYEAITALSMLEKAPLSASKEAPQAAMLKLQSLQRISKVTQDKADVKALEDYRTWVTRTYPNQAGAQLIRQSAIDAEVKQNFIQAIEEWTKLVKPGTETYEEAVFSVGFNRFREGDRLFGQAAKQRVAPEREKMAGQALDHWTKALASFKDHLKFVDKMPTKDAKAVKNAVGSLMFSCRILVHERINKSEEALAISQDVDKRFPTADPKLVIAIMSLRIDAKVKKGLVEEAEEDLRALKAKYDKEGLGLDHYQRALTVLAGAFMAAAAKEKEKSPEKYDLYGMKATEYYYQFYQLNPSAIQGNVEQMEAMAQMLFAAAESRLKAGQAKGDKDQVEEARKIYARCHELYKEYLLQRERELEKSEKGKEVIRGVKARVTRCLLMAGQFEEAIKMYEDVTRTDVAMKDGSSWEELADCYTEKARSLQKGAERNELLKRAEKIYAQLATMLISNQRFDEHAWRLLYKRGEVLFDLDLDTLRVFFNNASVRGWAPKWDSDNKDNVSRWGFQNKFEELRKKLDAVLPPKKP